MADLNVETSVGIIAKAIEESECSHISLRKKHQRIQLKTFESIGYLRKGRLSVYRLENDILTVNLEAPAIIGLAQMHSKVKSHYLRCDTECEILVIHMTDANILFTHDNLWMDACI